MQTRALMLLLALLSGCVGLEERLAGHWEGDVRARPQTHMFPAVLGPDMSLELGPDQAFSLTGGSPRARLEGTWSVFDGKVWLRPQGASHTAWILEPSADEQLLRDQSCEFRRAGTPPPAQAPPPGSPVECVLIDRSEPSYTVYMHVPAEFVAEVRSQSAGQPGLELVPWAGFAERSAELVAARIVHDAYPGARAVEGVVALLERYPGTPIGLTWNGGIAITRNDYQFAKRSYTNHLARPGEYAPPPPQADPVRPGAHLGPLLGW